MQSKLAQKIIDLQEKISTIDRKKASIKGALKIIKERLKVHKVETVEEAEEKLRLIRKQISKLETSINESVSKLEKEIDNE